MEDLGLLGERWFWVLVHLDLLVGEAEEVGVVGKGVYVDLGDLLDGLLLVDELGLLGLGLLHGLGL